MRFDVGSVALMVAAGASVAMAISAEACVPPPDLATPAPRPPRILRDSVCPPEGTPLGPGPWEFVVFVKLDGLVDSFQYEVVVDFTPPLPGNPTGLGLVKQGAVTVSPSALDGGVMSLPTLTIDSQIYDPYIHHHIEVLVALDFIASHTFDSRGGDSISWDYPGSQYDAGAFQDGFAPATDAGDALPIAAGDL